MNDPTITPSLVPTGNIRLTWQHVAMRLAGDIPTIAALAILGVLAVRGTANTQEFLIGTLATLGFKSWPRPVGAAAGIGALALVLFVAFAPFIGCGAGTPTADEQARVLTYKARLASCVTLAKTLPESEECRARIAREYGRDADAPRAIVADAGGE